MKQLILARVICAAIWLACGVLQIAQADVPISALPAGTTLSGTEAIPAVQSAATVKTTPAAITAYVQSQLLKAGSTASIGGSPLAAGACASGTVAVTGATTAMTAVASPVTYPGDGMVWSAQVTTSAVVTVRVCAIVSGTPTASVYRVRVLP